MTDLPSSQSRPDYEQALEPLTVEQTEAAVRLLIDTYYGGPQGTYTTDDRGMFHSMLAEALDG